MGNTSTAAHVARLNATLAELTARRDALVVAFPIRVDSTEFEDGDKSVTGSTQAVSDYASSAAETSDGESASKKSIPNEHDLHEADSLGSTSQSTPKLDSHIEKNASRKVMSSNPQFHTSSAAHTTPFLSLPRSLPTKPKAEPAEHSQPEHQTQIPSAPSPTQPQIDATLKLAHTVIQAHIKRLHDYNEVKDVAQMLMGLLADKRGVRIADVMEDFGVNGEMYGD